jgi:23S rRNA (uracil-5-)-methyltransferase RumA
MDYTTPPRCPHFQTCGGCLYQDIAYPEGQLDIKKKALNSVLGREVEIIPSPRAYGYRNRMDFVCAFSGVGLRARGRHDRVVDVRECHLISERAGQLLRGLKEGIEKYGIQDYDYLKHQGYLRYIVFRMPAHTKDLMVSFITADTSDVIMPLKDLAFQNATSVNWLVNNGLADTSFGTVHQFLGQSHFTEQIGGFRFRAGPNTFTQNNAYLTQALFDYIKAHVKEKVLDLFCGMGAISLYVSGQAENVFGIEREQESARFAHENKALNKVENADFVCEDVKKWLMANKGREFQTIILDPPRAGIGRKTIKHLLKLPAETIIYVSCNPKTFKEDMVFLQEQYDLQEVRGFDMFPQTPHVEIAGIMAKKRG